MRRKIILPVIILIICFSIILFLLYPKVSEEISNININQMSVEDFFTYDGNFYIYFSREDCRYCLNIEEDINEFEKEKKVYRVNPELMKDIKNYDWTEHELKYDVKIGELTDNGEINFYNGLTEENIREQYPPLYYKIILVNDGYAELHKGKEVGKIYAIYTHPELLQNELQIDNFIIPAIPFLVELQDHKVINYYFDDKEILNFLGSKTFPLDRYWNID